MRPWGCTWPRFEGGTRGGWGNVTFHSLAGKPKTRGEANVFTRSNIWTSPNSFERALTQSQMKQRRLQQPDSLSQHSSHPPGPPQPETQRMADSNASTDDGSGGAQHSGQTTAWTQCLRHVQWSSTLEVFGRGNHAPGGVLPPRPILRKDADHAATCTSCSWPPGEGADEESIRHVPTFRRSHALGRKRSREAAFAG